MKRNLLALAIGAAVLLPLTAQAAPTVYGRLNLSVDYVDVDATGLEPAWVVNSNASRIGVKGNEKLSDDFTAVYKAEWQINGDMAGGGDLGGRERYIGLKHSSLGTIRLGAIDSPLKTSEDMVDAFNDHAVLDMANLGNAVAGVPAVANVSLSGQSRLNNSINYVSPKVLDVFGANITFVPGESAAPCSVPPNGNPGCGNDLANGISAAFSYEDDNLYLSAALDKEIAGKDLIRAVGRYKMDKLVFAGLYQQGETVNAANSDETAFVFSASYEMDKLTFRGELLNNTVETGVATENQTDLIGVGVDYNFSQNTKVYGNLAQVKVDIAGTDTTNMLLGGGIEVRF
ncbi:MAG: porin [Fluviicoccus sp.]|uniref:porin n=1 Tax=Fluviicoccus sp. TaxID=2003552 RepID=UPI002729070F|nr:porin [Fluviicoccus sp.]MDO8329036.1 porin [Fluviicoccus sp.]